MERNTDIDKKILISSIRNVSDPKKAEEEIRKENIDLSELLKISLELLETVDLMQVFEKIVEGAVKLIGLDTGAIYFIQNDRLLLEVGSPPLPADFPDEFKTASLLNHPHIQKAVTSNSPLVINDISKEELTTEEKIITGARNMRSLLYIPLRVQKKVVGVLILATINRNIKFNNREIDLCHTLSNIASLSLENSLLFEKLNENVNEMEGAILRLKLFNQAIEQSPVSIVITSAEGNIEYVNPKFTELTGYTPDEAIGKNPRILNSGFHHDDYFKDLWATITSGRNWSGEFRNKNKKGEYYWESAVISPMVDDKGRITHFIGIKEDITDKKVMLENLIIAKEQAEESDKLKTAFIHNISHEIRTPLNAIIGFSGFLGQDDLDSPTKQKYVDIIYQSNKHLLNIINDIINISHIEAKQVEVRETNTNILKIFRNLDLQFQVEADKKNINFRTNVAIDGHGPMIMTDEGKLVQVLSNLLDNAFKFTMSGHVEIGCRRKDDFLEFYVEDTGIGIPDCEQEKIFERFYQVNKAISRGYGGTGLGLAISFSYVELLGGKLNVKSSPGDGSVFSFAIPDKQSVN
jgi:PAS domain S-box-containing protein